MHIIVSSFEGFSWSHGDLLEEYEHLVDFQTQIILLVLQIRELGGVCQTIRIALGSSVDLELEANDVVGGEYGLRVLASKCLDLKGESWKTADFGLQGLFPLGVGTDIIIKTTACLLKLDEVIQGVVLLELLYFLAGEGKLGKSVAFPEPILVELL